MDLQIEKNKDDKFRIRHAWVGIMLVNPDWIFKEFDTIEEAEADIKNFFLKGKWEIVKTINSADNPVDT